ncbi:MAG TPA: hypothetical protein PKJ45_14720 [Rubrivivax sp.]|nr:hypothetical protein [Rubrivivax sp.]
MTLPRLAPGADAPDAVAGRPATVAGETTAALRDVPVGPGGGKLLSNALCVARVELPTALCAHLRMGLTSQLLTAPLGLARALVAVARQAGKTASRRDPGRAARLELDRVLELPEGDLVRELTASLESTPWPGWVPRVAFVTPLGNDIATGIDRKGPPHAPKGIGCPLLAARLVSAIRGPVFLRDAAPALANLLNLWGGATPSGTWEIWLPVAPGRVRPLLPADSSTRGTPS